MAGAGWGGKLKLAKATEADVPAIVALRNAVAETLTQAHGRGHWTTCVTAKAVMRGLTSSRVLVARDHESIVGTVRLATKRPWAIDPKHFTLVPRPLYLHDLAVAPAAQRRGIGRLLVRAATRAARTWPADAIRLDAYDHAAGAGEFYVRCGFREVGRVTYRGVPLIYFELAL